MNKCPKCNSPLQATVPCYLSNVVTGGDGEIVSYKMAYFIDGALQLEPREANEGELLIYCENDHILNWDADSGEWKARDDVD